MKISVLKAMAQANGFGFPKTQARPKAPSSQKFAPEAGAGHFTIRRLKRVNMSYS